MSEKTKLYYTFGNHMHWVDMEWLWGYHVLPGSVRDMLHFCRETGTKGNVNFDGVGYEKLAAENPEALFELRAAVSAGQIEPVGCSYGQPYGLFHGGESNVRQRIYGARSVRRLLGVWPKTFWEEEFDFFPQLPQILKGCGFTGASLFFQWTWHTPEVPREEVPVIWWEGTDGTRLKTTTRNRLNLHQWPEDVDTMLADVAAHGVGERPLVQQWLELMPSPDWMCRSEVLLPKMKELLADKRFDVSPVTLGEYLEASPDDMPVRRYQMDDVWHGLTLGRSGDGLRTLSSQTEQKLLCAESVAAIASVFGRPYGQWDVYPTWELEEAWRFLLMAQHHDNDECEGLCGKIGYEHYVSCIRIADAVTERTLKSIGDAFHAKKPLILVSVPEKSVEGQDIKAFSLFESAHKVFKGNSQSSENSGIVRFDSEFSPEFEVDSLNGCVNGVALPNGNGVIGKGFGRIYIGDTPIVGDYKTTIEKDSIRMQIQAELLPEVSIHIGGQFESIYYGISFPMFKKSFADNIGPGLKNAVLIEVPLPSDDVLIYAGTPYSVELIQEGSKGVRKYPESDWMTSSQWFEDVEGAFTGLNFIDIVDPNTGNGIHVSYQGTKQWIKCKDRIFCVVWSVDPWDQGKPLHLTSISWMLSSFSLLLTPHLEMSDSERYRLGLSNLTHYEVSTERNDKLLFSFADIEQKNVLITALYRETEDFSGRHLDNYAGHVLAERIFGDIQPDQSRVYPFVMRLVEFDDITGEIELTICGEVSSVFKTNLLGQVETELKPEQIKDSPCKHPHTGKATKIRVPMRGKEIATLYFDIVEGRKQTRDLDAKREIWAQVHRIED